MAGHREREFEDGIEAHLLDHGWRQGLAGDYDVELGLDPVLLAEFVQATQPKEWNKVLAGYGSAASVKFARRVADEIDQHGTVHVLRKGVRDRGANVTLAYFKPTHGLTPELVALYEANRLLVYRQVHHSESNAHQSVDLLLSLNGIPVATAELRNPFTGQTAEDAVHQYQDPAQRNPKDRIFARRCLAHFAVDPTLVFVTTRLVGASTVFLPFNRGSGGAGNEGGKGNPDNPIGHRAAYLWEQVWQRDNWLDLLHRFAQETPPAQGRKVLFPRYHQWDVVRRLITPLCMGRGRAICCSTPPARGSRTPSPGWPTASPICTPLPTRPCCLWRRGSAGCSRTSSSSTRSWSSRTAPCWTSSCRRRLRFRSCPGDAAADRQELAAAPGGAGGHQDEDRDHDAAEVPGHRQ